MKKTGSQDTLTGIRARTKKKLLYPDPDPQLGKKLDSDPQ
jgi:hypothetical protein